MIDKYIVFLGDRRRILMSLGSTALFYCLSGIYRIKTDAGNVFLNEKELLVVNAGEKIGWEAEKGSLLFRVSIEESRLQRYMKQGKVRFLLNSPDHKTRDYHALRSILDTMIRRYPDQHGEFALWSLYYTLWDEMIKDFLLPADEEPGGPDLVYNEITAEIFTHFHEPLTAKAIASHHGMSESAFSRWFQKKGGIRFSEYLRRIRLEYAREQLLETESNVADIAFQCGFSNLSVFNHSFRDFYNMTPRQMRRQAALIGQKETAADAETIQQYIKTQAENNQIKQHSIKKIIVDSDSGFPVTRNAADILGPVNAADLLKAKHQEAIITLSRSLSVRAIKIVNLFSDEFSSDFDKESGSSEWCCEKMNIVFDFLLQYQLNPIIELSGICLIPLSQWNEVLSSFLKHMINRYTMEIVSGWHFEILPGSIGPNEPGTDYSCDFYTAAWHILQECIADPETGIGGINMNHENSVLRRLAGIWKTGKMKPSFISVICEPYAVNGKGNRGRFIADRHYLRDQLSLLHKFLKESSLDDIPIWVTEWNTPFSRTALYNDTCGKGCHMLMQLPDAAEMAERISCGCPSDWAFVSGKDVCAFFGGKGLISKDGIFKPFYHALQMFSFMGDTCLARGDGYYVTRRKDGYYSMLLYHPGTFSSIFHQSPEEDIKIEMLPFLYENQTSVDYLITFKNLKIGEYTVNSFEYRSNQESPLSLWAQLSYKASLNFGEINYLKSISVPRISFLPEQVNDGTLVLKYVLNLNDFQLILIAPQA